MHGATGSPHGECVPTSTAIRQYGIEPNALLMLALVVPTRLSSTITPLLSNTQ
jgi:hypothetical protein